MILPEGHGEEAAGGKDWVASHAAHQHLDFERALLEVFALFLPGLEQKPARGPPLFVERQQPLELDEQVFVVQVLGQLGRRLGAARDGAARPRVEAHGHVDGRLGRQLRARVKNDKYFLKKERPTVELVRQQCKKVITALERNELLRSIADEVVVVFVTPQKSVGV
jgi:hypothetical protein